MQKLCLSYMANVFVCPSVCLSRCCVVVSECRQMNELTNKTRVEQQGNFVKFFGENYSNFD